MEQINVVYRNLPTTIKGFSSRDENGDFVIVLNPKQSMDVQREAYDHEMRHILGDDFRKRSVGSIERKVRKKH